jgi:hypothetical protein
MTATMPTPKHVTPGRRNPDDIAYGMVIRSDTNTGGPAGGEPKRPRRNSARPARLSNPCGNLEKNFCFFPRLLGK